MKFADVKKAIKPSIKEKRALTQRAQAFARQLKVDAEVLIGGSVAKDTWLKNTHDIDIFVAFPYKKYKAKSAQLSDILQKALRSFKTERMHGSRDYFRIKQGDFTIEVVPILKITKADQALNITDVSPLHTKWVKSHTTAALRDDIRLAKQFFKAHGLYGAESYIKGFSGYTLEILTIHYGGFLKLLRASQKWKVKSVVDPANHHKDVFYEVNNSKLQSPLIVIDPVQAGRNASAALSLEKFHALQKAAKEFIKNPTARHFTHRPLDIEKLKKQKHIVVLRLSPLEGKRDVVGSKIEKAYLHIARLLRHHEFAIQKQGWEWQDHAYLYYKMKTLPLPSKRVVVGPPPKMEKHAAVFKKKYKNAKVIRGKLTAEVKRTYRTPEDLFPLMKNEVKGLVKRIELW